MFKLSKKTKTLIMRIVMVMLILIIFEEQWGAWGVTVIIIGLLLILGIRIYIQRESWKAYYKMAYDLGAMSKTQKDLDNMKVVKDTSSNIRQGEHRGSESREPDNRT